LIQLEILLEEPSMGNVIEGILAKIETNDIEYNHRIHTHQGKAHFLQQLPKILKGYNNWLKNPAVSNFRLLIIIDSDKDDCLELKQRILDLCQLHQLTTISKVRIAMPMLESWFFGDANALEQALPQIKKLKLGTSATYRQPENRPDPARDLDRELKSVGYTEGYKKLEHSKAIVQYMTIDGNKASSFNATINALNVLLSEAE
jgi:hypothetical protein